MRLRHVIILACGAGAAGALLLAADIHRRVQEAQRDALLNNAPPPGTAQDSVVNFGDIHMLGLLALAFLFLAAILLILAEPKTVTPAAETQPSNAPNAQTIAPAPLPAAVAATITPSVPIVPATPAAAPLLNEPNEPSGSAGLSNEGKQEDERRC